MIIKYPTGLYQLPSNGGSVTFTVSTQPPPRDDLLFPKLPPGVATRHPQPSPVTPTERRSDVAELIYTVNGTSRSQLGSSTLKYEAGELLEFGDVPTIAVAPFYAGDDHEIQHNSNVLDYAALGWDEELQSTLTGAANAKYDLLQANLATIRSEHSATKVALVENQKQINETNKAIAALTVLGMSDIVAGLRSRLSDLELARDESIARADVLATQASDLLASIRALAQVVR